jgi:hypothetical protein
MAGVYPSCFVSRSRRGTNLSEVWDARIYASPVGNPFARRYNFYRKVATIPRQFGNEQGGGRHDCRAPDTAQRVALRGAVRCRAGAPGYSRLEETGARFCDAALREVLRASSRPGHETK